jgi:hypothetical protein
MLKDRPAEQVAADPRSGALNRRASGSWWVCFAWMPLVLWQFRISKLPNSFSWSIRTFFDAVIVTTFIYIYGYYLQLHGVLISLDVKVIRAS